MTEHKCTLEAWRGDRLVRCVHCHSVYARETLPERSEFEQWYAENAFDYEKNPIGSRECGLQWKAWQAARATSKA